MIKHQKHAPPAGALAIGTSPAKGGSRHGRICRYAALVGVGLAGLVGALILPSRPLLVWNASASAPVGLYRVMSPIGLQTGDTVIARLPHAARDLAARRHYLPANVPLVKTVAAVSGDVICARDRQILVNDIALVTRREVDGQGRLMPWWQGCRTLRHGSVLLITTAHPDSFDGRYFGPTPAENIVGRAQLLWAR